METLFKVSKLQEEAKLVKAEEPLFFKSSHRYRVIWSSKNALGLQKFMPSVHGSRFCTERFL